MKFLAALLLVIALVCAPYRVELSIVDASALPWKTFSAAAKDADGVYNATCGSEDIMSASLSKDGKRYSFFTNEAGRYLFVELKDGAPVRVWIGESLPSPNQDTIKILDEHAYDSNRDGGGPCGHLFPKQA